MTNKLTLEGPNRTYLVAVNLQQSGYGYISIMQPSMSEFIIANLDSNMELKLTRLNEQGLINAINQGFEVENIKIKDGRIVPKGDKLLSDYSSTGFRQAICLAEVEDEKGGIGYFIIGRNLQRNIISKAVMINKVKMKLIDNYYLTADGQLKRNPGQEVSRLKAKSLIVDTHWEITNDELETLLKSNGFKLGFKSIPYKTKGYYDKPDEWVEYAWYDNNGAVVFYNAYVRDTGLSPFYSGANLYIDADVVMNPSDIMTKGIPLGNHYSTKQGHQRLYMDARENLMSQYRRMLTAIRPLNPWQYKNRDSEYLSGTEFYRKDLYENIQKFVFEMPGAPDKKQHDMFMYGTYSQIAMYYTVKMFKGELRAIFSEWEETFPDRIALSATRAMSMGPNYSGTPEQIEELLKKFQISIPKPLKQYIAEEKAERDAKKKAADKEWEERQRQLNTPRNANKQGIKSIWDMFKPNK